MQGLRHHPHPPSRPDGLPGIVPVKIQRAGHTTLAQRHPETAPAVVAIPSPAKLANQES